MTYVTASFAPHEQPLRGDFRTNSATKLHESYCRPDRLDEANGSLRFLCDEHGCSC